MLVFLAGHGLGHVLVDLVHKLAAVFNHLIHCEVLKEMAIIIAVLTVIKVDAAVGIVATVIIAGPDFVNASP